MNAATMNVNAKVSDLDCTPDRQCVRGEGRRVRARSPGGGGGGCQGRRRPAGNGRRRHNFSGRRGHLGQGGSHSPVTQFGLTDPSPPQAQSSHSALLECVMMKRTVDSKGKTMLLNRFEQ